MKKTVAIVSGAPALFERPDVRMIVPATAAGSNRGSAALMSDVCASEMLYVVSGSGGALMPGNTQVGDRLYFSIDSPSTPMTVYLPSGETLQQQGTDSLTLFAGGFVKISPTEWIAVG